MKASQIAQAIINGNFSSADLKIINDATREAYDLAQRRAKFAFHVGQQVQFRGRGGAMIKGEVIKLAQKNIQVRAHDGVIWRVSPSLVSAVVKIIHDAT